MNSLFNKQSSYVWVSFICSISSSVIILSQILWGQSYNLFLIRNNFYNRTLSGFHDQTTLLKFNSQIISYGWLIIPLLALMYFSLKQTFRTKAIKKELVAMKEKAELTEKLKSDFLSQISHEIRTPLHLMLNYSSILKEECEKIKLDERDDIIHYFRIIDLSGKRMIRTLDQIINMAQLHTKTFHFNPSNIDVYANIVMEVFNNLLSYAEKQGLVFDLVKETEHTNSYIDEFSVIQVISNLVDNGIKYTPKGSVIVYLQRNSEDKLVIKIVDTGIGISEDYLPKLFTSFSQEEQGYSRPYEGTGLGLALVKQYCDINHISIDVESRKGEGTTFTLTFNS
jgi:signal transduction histidine kinase